LVSSQRGHFNPLVNFPHCLQCKENVSNFPALAYLKYNPSPIIADRPSKMKFMDAELSTLEKLLLHMMSHSGIALYDNDFIPNAVPGTNIIPTKTSTRIDFMK